ncbi:cytochrome c oxidase subunit 2A [Paraburkholderia fungorum]|uniref:cytochrome c oxidase subunit 2A n=1 Tax=Paraburkholderia fungorum TaxID=134537 RepID=UPI0038BCF685
MEANDTRSAAPPTDEEVERVVAAGPHGAIAVAGIATLIVMAIWFGFYFLFFLPRGVIH